MPPKMGWLALVALFFVAGACTTATGRDRTDLLISNVVLYDGTGAPPMRRSVVVDRSRIAAILAADAALPDADRTVDGSGGTLLPGLYDMHVHLAEDRIRADLLPGFVRFGVTSVRDAGGRIEQLLAWNREARQRRRIAPIIHSVGATLNGPGDTSFHREIVTPEDAERAVAWLAAAGVSQVKVHDRLSSVAFRAILSAANRRWMTVFGHVPRGIRPLDACALGMDGFEHLSAVMGAFVRSREDSGLAEAVGWLRGPSSNDFYHCLATGGRYVDPTLVTLRYLGAAEGGDMQILAERQIEALLPVVRRMHEAGILLIAGSDVGLGAADMPAGRSLVEELMLLHRSGLAWPAVIRIATLNAAQVLGVDSERGSIAPGNAADLVLYAGDPFADPTRLFTPVRVWIDGRQLFARSGDASSDRDVVSE